MSAAAFGVLFVLAFAGALIGLALVDLRTVPVTGTVAALLTIAALVVAVHR
ncbi:hypothetical protein ACSCBZ_24755 [Streptomyces niveiscabiei]|uniref:hypothetical protein n=1 Tax=Streptomyces niveiscabiei TaxID=164115 RepID=UPI000AA83694|nr:hypothetical protein [Streptomyces niveiscabiei]